MSEPINKEPTIDDVTRKVRSKYALVVLAARRARMLTDREESSPEAKIPKAVTVALREIANGKVTYQFTRGGPK